MLTKQQLEMRKTGLGGSDISAALGISPWKTQLQLWAEKVGRVEQGEPSEAMEWGSRLEAPILSKFEQNHRKFKVSHGSGTVRSHEHQFLLASPDGFIVDRDGKSGILEVKTSSDSPWDDIPAHYELQARHYCYVLGRQFAYFAVLFRGNQYREYGPYFFDSQEYEDSILPKLQEFWQAVEGQRPIFEPVDLSDLAHIIDLNPDLEPMQIDPSHEAYRIVSNIRALQERNKASDEKIRDEKLKLAELMGPHMKMVDENGKTLVTQTVVADSTAVDSKVLKDKYPEIYDECSKVRKGWRSMRVW